MSLQFSFMKNRGARKTQGQRGERAGDGGPRRRRHEKAEVSIKPPASLPLHHTLASSSPLLTLVRSLPALYCFIAHSCSRLLRTHSYNMTVTSKMNSVSRQSVLSRLGPGGLLYAANKIIAVRHQNVFSARKFM